jgi:polysaccharide export outer membrane protein
MRVFTSVALLGAIVVASGEVGAQAPRDQARPATTTPLVIPADYVIGPEDVLTIIIVGLEAYSGDVVVRPDGTMTCPRIDDIKAASLTPLQLKAALTKAYAQVFQEPVILVIPKQINSRNVRIAGLVYKPGDYRLTEPMNLLQLIVLAGGLQPSADKNEIRIVRRRADGSSETIVFNYTALFDRNSVTKVPELKPGDQVIVK